MKRLLYVLTPLLLVSLPAFAATKVVESKTGHISEDAAAKNNEAACIQMVMECDHVVLNGLAHPVYGLFSSSGNPSAQDLLQNEVTAYGSIPDPGPQEIVARLNMFDTQGYYYAAESADPGKTVGVMIGWMQGWHRPAMFWLNGGTRWVVVTKIEYDEFLNSSGVVQWLPKWITYWDPVPTTKAPVPIFLHYNTFKMSPKLFSPVVRPGTVYHGKYVAITDPNAPPWNVVELAPRRLCDRYLYAHEALTVAVLATNDLGAEAAPAFEEVDYPLEPIAASWDRIPCYVVGFLQGNEFLASVMVINAETAEPMVALPLREQEYNSQEFLEYLTPPFDTSEISSVDWGLEPGGPAWEIPIPEERR